MFDVISAGHLCLDISPKIPEQPGETGSIFIAGKLTNVNELVFAVGGASANVGIGLKKLGINSRIVGKIGNDEIGGIISQRLKEQNIDSNYIIRKNGDSSSYTIVIAQPGIDRIFLHFPGANDTFVSNDIDFDLLKNARLFHFGYPPLMKYFYSNEGKELTDMMKKAKETGITTSLDLSLPDPNSMSGKADWVEILSNALQYVDIFTPSIEELMYMLDRESYDDLKKLDNDILKNIKIEHLSSLSNMALAMGCKIVVIKCGVAGYYIRTSDQEKLSNMGRAKPKDIDCWVNKEMFSNVYSVEKVLSSTGSGDCSIAGFFAAMLTNKSPELAINVACGVGANSVATYGATDGVVPLEEVITKINNGWTKIDGALNIDACQYDAINDSYYIESSDK